MHQTLIPRLTSALSWPEQDWDHVLVVLAERPSRRTVQRLPAAFCIASSSGDTDLISLGAEAWEDAIAA